VTAAFHVQADQSAQEWMRSHIADRPRLIAYDVHRCCGGGKICTVTIRERSRGDDVRDYATAELPDGTRLLVDPRAAHRLPPRFGLTVRGLGPFKRLDLDLAGEEWGALLYD
jgi:hypothetical protein